MSKELLIAKLNEILRYEWTGVAQYNQYSFLVRGVWREVYADKFKDDADESLGHARRIADKIAAMGGVPTLERGEVKQTLDLDEMLANSLAFEQGAVDIYTAVLAVADEAKNRPLVILLEDILLAEQDGVDEYTKLLAGDSAASSKSRAKVG
jgi:bacterioferritin